MKNFKLFLIIALTFVASVSFFVPLKNVQAAEPTVGSVRILGADGDINRLGKSGAVYFELLGTDGKPYPLNPTDPTKAYLFSFDVTQGDGQIVKSIFYANDASSVLYNQLPVDQVAVGAYGLHGHRVFKISANQIRKTQFCTLAAGRADRDCPSSSAPANDIINNPLVPGPVTLTNVTVRTTGGSEDYFALSTKLFTVSNPPTIDSISNSNVKGDETIDVNGTNFDSLTGNTLYVDLILNNSGLGGINMSKYPTEDRTHYCNDSKMKYDVPSYYLQFAGNTSAMNHIPMPAGQHMITVYNDFGVSNAFPVNFTGQQGSSVSDSACGGTSWSTITGISPTSGSAGTAVTINGKNFQWSDNFINNNYNINNLVLFAPSVRPEVTGYTPVISTDAKGIQHKSINQIQIKIPSGMTTSFLYIRNLVTGFDAFGPDFTVSGATTVPVNRTTTTPTTPGTAALPRTVTTGTVVDMQEYLQNMTNLLNNMIQTSKSALTSATSGTGTTNVTTTSGAVVFNLSTNGGSNMAPGDSYTLSVTTNPALANQDVILCTTVAPSTNGSAGTCTPAANLGFPAKTNSSGVWLGTNIASTKTTDVGAWRMYAKVGNSSSNEISFNLGSAAVSSGSISVSLFKSSTVASWAVGSNQKVSWKAPLLSTLKVEMISKSDNSSTVLWSDSKDDAYILKFGALGGEGNINFVVPSVPNGQYFIRVSGLNLSANLLASAHWSPPVLSGTPGSLASGDSEIFTITGGTTPSTGTGSSGTGVTNINFPITVTVTASLLNVRSAPNTQSTVTSQLKKGDTFTATASVKGDNVEGTNDWWLSSKGNYVWSGGTMW